MNHYRRFYLRPLAGLLLFIALLGLPLLLLAQTNAPGTPPGVAATSFLAKVLANNKLPMLLAVIVPALLAVVKLVLPKLPPWLLPILAPGLGWAGNWLMTQAGLSTLPPEWAALLGSAGVGIRELKDQVHTRIGGPAGNGAVVGLLLLGSLAVVGCADLNRNLFRAEQLATQAGHGAMTGYALQWKNETNGAPADKLEMLLQERAMVEAASRKLGNAVLASEQWRVIYATNATVKPYLEAAGIALVEDSSNLVWTVKSFTH